MTDQLRRGSVVWVSPDPTRGREQAGTRPAVIVASAGYLANVPELVILVPVTTRDRGWPHHVKLTGAALTLDRTSFAMTEQPRTVARSRITGQAGTANGTSMDEIDQWLRDFTDL
jgi:mRNA interferase MazF